MHKQMVSWHWSKWSLMLLALLSVIPEYLTAQELANLLEQIRWEKDGAQMMLIPAGQSAIGDQLDGLEQSIPISFNGFYLDQTEVTVGQFKRFAEETDYAYPMWSEVARYSPTDEHPMVYVNWHDATAYAKWAEKRLPTEAEWEYAARGGLVGKRYPWGNGITHNQANYEGIEGEDQWGFQTAPVGKFEANRYGLYDMAGNVWEWCANPTDPDDYRPIRGGSWHNDTFDLRTAYRTHYPPSFRSLHFGFRCLARYKDHQSQEPALPSSENTDGSITSQLGEDHKPAMVMIPAGTFEMGDNKDDPLGWLEKSRPIHTVMVNVFYMDQTEVTVGQFRRFVEAADYQFTRWQEVSKYAPTDRYPMVYVSWYDATAYAEWAGKRLPTEAEWEHAARGGLISKRYPWGDEITSDRANSKGVKGQDQWRKTAPVGQFKANGYGLSDMAGNVWEWCSDWYGEDYYANSPVENPTGSSTGLYRILRGGSWLYDVNALRVAYRNLDFPQTANAYTGFRCVKDIPLTERKQQESQPSPSSN